MQTDLESGNRLELLIQKIEFSCVLILCLSKVFLFPCKGLKMVSRLFFFSANLFSTNILFLCSVVERFNRLTSVKQMNFSELNVCYRFSFSFFSSLYWCDTVCKRQNKFFFEDVLTDFSFLFTKITILKK